MKVWIDQHICTGDGICEEIAPDVFVGMDDGLFYVKDGDHIYADSVGKKELKVLPQFLKHYYKMLLNQQRSVQENV